MGDRPDKVHAQINQNLSNQFNPSRGGEENLGKHPTKSERTALGGSNQSLVSLSVREINAAL